MKTYEVTVTTVVEITVDEEKLNDPEFQEDFKAISSHFDDIEDHIAHLGWAFATGRAELDYPQEFVEGYGKISEMSISGRHISFDVDEIKELD